MTPDSPAGPDVDAARPPRSGRGVAIACGLAALLGGLVYLNALHNPFVYDDYRTILDNGSIVSLTDWRAILLHDASRPVVNLSYAIDRHVSGMEPMGFHVTSVVLHMINVVLLFWLAWRGAEDFTRRGSRGTAARVSLPPITVAFVAASLFAVHPMMTEAVAYVSGRSEVLCATWLLAAILCARRWMVGRGARWWLLSAGFWAAALLTKEIAVMFPLLLLSYDRLAFDDTPADRRERFAKLHAPLLGIAVLAAVARVGVLLTMEHSGALRMDWRSVLVELNVAARYVQLMVVPSGQTIFHDVRSIAHAFSVQALWGAVAIGILVAVAWRGRRASPLAAFGVCWFLLLLLPSAALVILNHGEGMAEHRVYAASCGLFLAAGGLAGWITARLGPTTARVPWIATAVLAGVLLSLSGRTLLRNAIWSSQITLWQEAVDRAPDNPLPRTALAESLQIAGRSTDAIDAYRVALRLDPDDDAVYLKLGLCLAEAGQLEAAAATFERLRQISPDSPVVSTGVAVVTLMAGRTAEARDELQRAIDRDPQDLMARRWLAVLEEEFAENPAEALRQCEEIRRIAPGRLSDDECVSRNRARLAAAGAGSH